MRCRFSFYRDLPLGQVSLFYYDEAQDLSFPEVLRRIRVGAWQYARRNGWKFSVSANPDLKRVMVHRYA